ncbi:hypothetical protein EV128_12223 [Rhizobium azibense]|nr:hypothetical protein EV128_12223 [Rhizobium azibense]
MQVHALLENRKVEIVAEIEKLQTELSEIDRMLGVATHVATPVSGMSQARSTPVAHTATLPVPATKDDAIIAAIADGCRTPAAISDFIRKKMGMEVNDASTRTRLSRMKAAAKIDHDGNGWKLK